MTGDFHLLDVVALVEDLPERNLRRGQVGTIVESLGPGVFEVEFGDGRGRTHALVALSAHQLTVVHSAPTNQRPRST